MISLIAVKPGELGWFPNGNGGVWRTAVYLSSALLVGRLPEGAALYPGKFGMADNFLRFSSDTVGEKQSKSYELLLRPGGSTQLEWMSHSSAQSPPDGAVVGGFNGQGEKLYVVRGTPPADTVKHGGYFNPASYSTRIPHSSTAVNLSSFEILNIIT